jgi:hypothetical protein
MADMESDGLYFPEEIKEKLAKDGIPVPSKKSDTETLEDGK